MTFTNTQTKLGQAITTNDSGDYAVRTIIEGDQTLENLTLTGDLNGGGGHILNEQTTTNMMSKGTVYNLNGTSAFIAFDALAVHLNNTNNTVGSVNIVGQMGDMISGDDFVWMFGDTDAQEYLFMSISPTDNTLKFKCRLSTVDQWEFDTDATFSEDTDMDIRLVHDGTAPVLYVNGILQDITFAINTDKTIWFADLTGIDNCRVGCGNWASQGNVNFSEITVARFGYDNFAPTASEVKDLISGNIPFKWQYGSQTDLVTSAIVDTSWSFDTFSGASADGFTAVYSTSGTQIAYTADEITLEEGKAYRISFDVTLTSGTYPVTKIRETPASGTLQTLIPSGGATTGAQSLDYISTATGTYTLTWEAAAAVSFAIANLNFVEIGAVALYDQTSISETTWYDKANGNDGAVTGASVLNNPSVSPLACLRSVQLLVDPGTTPNTNIDVQDVSSATNSFNASSLTNGTDIAKGGSSGSFSLDASGVYIEVDTPESVVGILSNTLVNVDMNSSTTSQMYFLSIVIASGKMRIYLKKRGSVNNVDWTTVIDAGDSLYFMISYITST